MEKGRIWHAVCQTFPMGRVEESDRPVGNTWSVVRDVFFTSMNGRVV